MKLLWRCRSCDASFDAAVCPQCGRPPLDGIDNIESVLCADLDRDADTATRYEDAVASEIAVVGRILVSLLACLTAATLILSLCWSPYYAPAAALCAFGLGYSIPRKEPHV